MLDEKSVVAPDAPKYIVMLLPGVKVKAGVSHVKTISMEY